MATLPIMNDDWQVESLKVFSPLQPYTGTPRFDLFNVSAKCSTLSDATSLAPDKLYNWGFVRGYVPTEGGYAARVFLVLQFSVIPELLDKNDEFVPVDNKVLKRALQPDAAPPKLMVVGHIDTGCNFDPDFFWVPVVATAEAQKWLTDWFGSTMVGRVKLSQPAHAFEWQRNRLYPALCTTTAEEVDHITILKLHCTR